MQDKHSKTEQATPKRLRDSRKKGQTPKSHDLGSSASFLIFTLLLLSLGEGLFKGSLSLLRTMLGAGGTEPLTLRETGKLLLGATGKGLLLFLPFGAVAMVTAWITGVAQVGFLFTAEPLKPDFKRLNPIEGMKNLFSSQALFNLVKSLLKLFLVSYLTFSQVKELFPALSGTGQMGLEKLFPFFLEILATLSKNIAFLMVILGVADFIVQKRKFKKNLMMTKQEIKEEYKQMEGDPKMKSLRQQKQREMSRSRTLQRVEEATVVITNPTHLAIALRYEPGKDEAPVVLAKGVDHMAQKIRERATEKGIPLMENKPLARALYPKVEEGDTVPVEMYQAIAEILALVYQKKNAR